MQHHKLVYFCQRCKKEHDRTESPLLETGVICGINGCQGYIITPAGRANIQIRQLTNVFFIQGAKQAAWIAADTQKEARKHYVDMFDDTLVSVSKFKQEEMSHKRFAYDPEETKDPNRYVWLSADEVLTNVEDLPAVLFNIRPEIFQAWLEEKKKNGEL